MNASTDAQWLLIDQAYGPALQILIAFVIALPVAFDREKDTRGMGLRTFPIVSMVSCGFVLIGLSAPGDDAQLTSRIMQGLITGVGFIGGGAILKNSGSVHGSATAAQLVEYQCDRRDCYFISVPERCMHRRDRLQVGRAVS